MKLAAGGKPSVARDWSAHPAIVERDEIDDALSDPHETNGSDSAEILDASGRVTPLL